MTRESLIAEIQSGFVSKWAFFWDHTPATDGFVAKACFSQWCEGHPFEIEGVRYATAEPFMMAEKAHLFGDEPTRSDILVASSPISMTRSGIDIPGTSSRPVRMTPPEASAWTLPIQTRAGLKTGKGAISSILP